MGETLDTRETGFSTIGGSPVLDLANTIAWRLDPDRSIERLVDEEAAVSWARQFGFLHRRRSRRVARIANGLREVREHVYAAAFLSDPDSAAALLALDREWWTRVRLEPGDGGWEPVEHGFDDRSVILRVAHQAIEVVLGDLSGLKQCADAQCGWIYLDTSPRRNRRWCAADDCGARNRARAHYHRHH